MFKIFYDSYDESDPQSANPRFGAGSVDVYQFLPQSARITNILRNMAGAVQDHVLPGSSWVTNQVSQSLLGTNLIDTNSPEYDQTDTAVTVFETVVTLPAAGAGVIKAAKLGPRLFGRHTIGLLNRNDVLRIGWSWKGSAKTGKEVFRIAVGSKRGSIHKHITLWTRK